MIRCLHCGAETSNGLALCDLCRTAASKALEFIPIYFRNLARWRPGRAGTREVPGSRVLYDGTTRGSGTGDRISDTLDEANTMLVTWARCLSDDRTFVQPYTLRDAVLTGSISEQTAAELADDIPRQVALLCSAFDQHLTSISTLDWTGEFVRDLGGHEQRLRELTETYVPGWYAGACRMCGASTYVVPGLTWVTCGACGATTAARDRLPIILAEARDWIAPPMRIAEALVALIDTEESARRLHKRISKWGERERIPEHRRRDRDGDPVGPKRYRLGDVLARIEREGATRPDLADDTRVARAC